MGVLKLEQCVLGLGRNLQQSGSGVFLEPVTMAGAGDRDGAAIEFAALADGGIAGDEPRRKRGWS
jgi:hypothetical protein